MTTLLLCIAIVFAVFVAIDTIEESKDYRMWLKKAKKDFNVEPRVFKDLYNYAANHKLDGITASHKAYLMLEEEWYDLNCK